MTTDERAKINELERENKELRVAINGPPGCRKSRLGCRPPVPIEAVDQVRRQEQPDHPELKRTRCVWLKNDRKEVDPILWTARRPV